MQLPLVDKHIDKKSEEFRYNFEIDWGEFTDIIPTNRVSEGVTLPIVTTRFDGPETRHTYGSPGRYNRPGVTLPIVTTHDGPETRHTYGSPGRYNVTVSGVVEAFSMLEAEAGVIRQGELSSLRCVNPTTCVGSS